MTRGERLSAALARLDAAGLSRREQADLLGLYPTSLSRLVGGRREPSMTLVLLAERVASARRKVPQRCHGCGGACDYGLEDVKGRPHCEACYDAAMEDWHERGVAE